MIDDTVALQSRSHSTDERERVSVVLPCLNEAGSVGPCVREARASMERAGIRGEVVVVDNGSTDGSDRLALEAGARVIREPQPGYGSALVTGIAGARGEIVVMADADVSYDLSRIPDLVRPVLDGQAEMVLGSRVANGRAMPFIHRFIGTPILTFLVARASGRKATSDSQSGFRAFRRERFLALRVRGTGMEFASEMLIKAARAGWRISETPTDYRERVGESKLNTFRDGWRHVRLIVLLAPDLVLIWPGVAALAGGVAVSIWSLMDPGGIQLGSIRWQPVFFSTIAMVIGAQALLAGLVIAYQSSMAGPLQRATFVASVRFLRWCVRGGVIIGATGLLIDFILFFIWVRGGPTPLRVVQLASLAQGLIMVGITATVFGLVTRLVMNGRARDAQVQEMPLEGGA